MRARAGERSFLLHLSLSLTHSHRPTGSRRLAHAIRGRRPVPGRPHAAGPGGGRVWPRDGAPVRAAVPGWRCAGRRGCGRARLFGGQVCDVCAACGAEIQRVRGMEERGCAHSAHQGVRSGAPWRAPRRNDGAPARGAPTSKTHKRSAPVPLPLSLSLPPSPTATMPLTLRTRRSRRPRSRTTKRSRPF